ncbi:flagellar basal body P-ring formation chaperone FlgA [Sinisalibacter aestuarii]|uniref:Flagella basal body P-ring formation protein FlgA n=1 Tax=Sinisalibacter aestuarii TaxID=2949426 RepID=A0ABQ5LNW4_9RHOB|nr:flagellar basal body P-ring formation chaperone FlgA [Sinisalibacter aestuarii]GKY86687.1 flagella basal body P-ring formation protein FlgA [Sinisalibacter aestuarii]
MTRLFALLALMATPAQADTVIAARTIRAQSILTPGDVTLVAGDIAGTYVSLDEVIGQEARVVLYAGRPVRSNEVGPPAIVARNQIVTLFYRAGGLMIAAEGRALGRAGVGDRLRVMNLASRQMITGIVRDDGTVTVAPGATRFPDLPVN